MTLSTGRVTLIGAGCGRADLITLRGLRALEECDAVVYDDLIDPALLDAAPPQALRLYMGKRHGKHSATQDEICRTLIGLARQGRRVARLKGGDPYVFGRGGEEMTALLAAGIPCDEIPGISSPIAIPAEAGIPVTFRSLSQSLHILTGHTADAADGLPPDLERLASLEGTLVFLMGLSHLEQITARLLSGGKSPDTPAAVLSGGCAPHPAALRGTLADIAVKARQSELESPAVILIGPTAALELTCSGRLLDGIQVGLTGTVSFQNKFRPLLEVLGARVRSVMKSTVEPLSPNPTLAALEQGTGWLIFTSPNGAGHFLRLLDQARFDLRRLSRYHIAVIGPATGAVLERRGLYPELCPQVSTSVQLAQSLVERAVPDETLLLLRSLQATGTLPGILHQHGRSVLKLPLYTVQTTPLLSDLSELDYLLFASAGGVSSFLSCYGPPPTRTRCLAIGPVTAQALTDQHIPALIAGEPTPQAMVSALCQNLEGSPKSCPSR